MQKRIAVICVSILIVIVLFAAWHVYDNFIFIKPSDYDRSMYSVVLHNDTNETINNISVDYYRAPDEENKEFERISDLAGGEYRKINIPTDIQEYGSYNVEVSLDALNGGVSCAAGYFGTETGEFAVIEIAMENNVPTLTSLPQSTREYKPLYRRHLKNQPEISWYD